MRVAQGAFTSLIQGVSQQPAAVRFDGQCDKQINMSSDATRGLCRRGPAELVGFLPELQPYTDWRFQDITLADDVRYWVAYREGMLKVFRATDATPVEVQGDFSYITGAECSFVTSLGVTYIADSSVIVKKSEAVKAVRYPGHILGQVLGGAFSRNMQVTLSYDKGGVHYNKTAVYNTGTGVNAEDSARLDTSAICGQLVSALNATVTDWNWHQSHDVFWGIPKEGTPILNLQVYVSDGSNNVNLAAYADACSNVERIPSRAAAGYQITVLGLGGSDADDYYLEYVPDNGSDFTSGIWREVAAPGLAHAFDKSTMPHTLVFEDGVFQFAEGEWEPRAAGDEDTNPTPSFVGYTIADLAAFQGRLTIVPASSTVCASRTNKPLDFWAKSATVVSDSDPLDLESSFKEGLTIKRACLHNRDLVLFSEQAQCTVFGRNSITPSNASVVVSTSFKADLHAAPVETGSSVFFAVQYGQYSGIREFFTQPSSDANNSNSITSHVAQYIKGRVSGMAASTNFDILVVTTDAEDNAVYCYQYVNTGAEKAQASWSKWYMHGKVLRMQFFESELHMLVSTADGIQLCSLGIDRVPDEGLTYQVHLDQKRPIPDAHTSLMLPSADKQVYVQGPGCPNPGMLVPVTSKSTDEVIFGRDMQGGTVIAGYPYTSEYTPTRPFIRGQDGAPVLSSRLILRTYRLSFSESGAFEAIIKSPYVEDTTVPFSMRMTGDIHNIIGEECVYSDVVTVPVRADPEHTKVTVKCEEHTPLYITQLQWSGQMSNRAAR